MNENANLSTYSVAYGLYLKIDEFVLKHLEDMRKKDQYDRHVDVVIEYDGITHEFTLDEFIKRLVT